MHDRCIRISKKYMKSFIAKRIISILVNLRYLRFKLLKYKENNKKICNTFDHNFKNIPLYIMSNVSLERYYFVLYDGALTLKMSKMALNTFCDKTLHMYIDINPVRTRHLQMSIFMFGVCGKCVLWQTQMPSSMGKKINLCVIFLLILTFL